jgi:hypothetical protein
MRFLLLLVVGGMLVAQPVDVVPVRPDLVKKFAKHVTAAHKVEEEMEKYCESLHRELAQNRATGEFGCLVVPPDEPTSPNDLHVGRQ